MYDVDVDVDVDLGIDDLKVVSSFFVVVVGKTVEVKKFRKKFPGLNKQSFYILWFLCVIFILVINFI